MRGSALCFFERDEMATTLSNRKQRLRTLENRIRKNYESFVQTGQDLKEIRDEELYREDGFETWTVYLKVRVGEAFGIEKSQADVLIRCAEIRPKLPDLPSPGAPGQDGWSQRAISEFARLAPASDDNERRYNYSKIDKRDAARVAKEASRLAEAEDKPLSSRHVRVAVDKELGIDRGAKSRETKNKANNGIDLANYLTSKVGQIEAITEHLSRVPGDAWTLLEESDPGLAERLAGVCDDLAALLRS